MATRLVRNCGPLLTVKTTAGVEAKYGLDALSSLDFTLSKIQYLSDLKPVSVKSQDALLAVARPNDAVPDASWARYEVANDRNLDGGRASLDRRRTSGRWVQLRHDPRDGRSLRAGLVEYCSVFAPNPRTCRIW